MTGGISGLEVVMKYTDVMRGLYKVALYRPQEERDEIWADKYYGQAPYIDTATGRHIVSLDPGAFADSELKRQEASLSENYDLYKSILEDSNKRNKSTEGIPTFEEYLEKNYPTLNLDKIYNNALNAANKYVDYTPPFQSIQDLYNYSPEEARQRFEQWDEDWARMPSDIERALYPEYDMKPGWDLYGTDPDAWTNDPYYNINAYMSSDFPTETPEDLDNLVNWLAHHPVSGEESIPLWEQDEDFESYKQKFQDYMQRNVYDKFKPAEPPDVRQITPQKIVMGNDKQRLYDQEQRGPRKLDTTYLPRLADGTITMGSFGAQPKQPVGTPAPQLGPQVPAPTNTARQPYGRDTTAFGVKPSYVDVQNQRTALTQQPR